MMTSMTTGLPNQAVYTGENPFLFSGIMLDSPPSLEIDFTDCTTTYSAVRIGILFKSEQLSRERRMSYGAFFCSFIS